MVARAAPPISGRGGLVPASDHRPSDRDGDRHRRDAEQPPDIGFDPLGTLYGWCQKGCGGQIAPDDLVIIDFADGSHSIVGDSGFSSGQSGLALDSLGGLFMDIVNSLNATNPANPSLFDSLAFDPTDQLFRSRAVA